MERNDLSDYELRRLQNIEDNKQMMKQLGLLNTQFPEIRSTPSQKLRRKRLRESSESSFTPRRRSERLASLNSDTVQFSEEVSKTILGEGKSCQVYLDGDEKNRDEYDFDDEFDIGKENMKRKKIHHHRKQNSGTREIISVDEITEDHLQRVCEFVSQKEYSQDGTTCHQCRQKTLDQKTYCRSKECFGIRGQFCGPCLKNRYGESVLIALKDPEWFCPPCRGLCNCSICRTQKGKIPTGQLYHFAQERGYKSVRHFLEKEVDSEDEF